MKTLFLITLLSISIWSNPLEYKIISSNRTQFTFAPKGLIAVVPLDGFIKSGFSDDTDDLNIIYGYNSEGFEQLFLYIMDSRTGRAKAYTSLNDTTQLCNGIARFYIWSKTAKENQVTSFQKTITDYEKSDVGLIFNVDSKGKCYLKIIGVGIKRSYSGIISNPQKIADALAPEYSKSVFKDLWNTRIKEAQKERETNNLFQ